MTTRPTEKRVRDVEHKLEAGDYQPIVVTTDPEVAETRFETVFDSRGRRVIRMILGRDNSAARVGFVSYAGFWVTRRSGGVVCRRFDDLDAILESDTSDDLRQLICTFQPPPGL